jgi:bifunctional DNA-binding transcriptional regulator/antitoxin component of YhaV-PrlF toxin-antitoxin module
LDFVVELDDRGRILIPRELRRGLPSRWMVLKKLGNDLLLSPLPDPRSLKGKYRVKGSMEEIEEDQECTVMRRG